MSETNNKRSTRKSKGFRSRIFEKQYNSQEQDVLEMMSMDMETEKNAADAKQESAASRVVDMSWAAEYLDDDWESKHRNAGNFDTRVMKPITQEQLSSDPDHPIMFDLMADSMKGLEAGVNGEDSEMAETIGIKTNTEGQDIPESPMAATQEYKIPDESSEFNRHLRTAIAELEYKDAKVRAKMAGEAEEKTYPEDLEDIIKIRDAETDKTIVSIEDAKRVRDAAANLGIEDDLDDIVKIRDAETDKTIYSVEDARRVRDAVTQNEFAEKMFSAEKIRDAETNKTIVSLEDARLVREAAADLDVDFDFEEITEIRDSASGSSEQKAAEEVFDISEILPAEEVEKTKRIVLPEKISKKSSSKKSRRKKAEKDKIAEINVEDLITDEDDLLESLITDKGSRKRSKTRRPAEDDFRYDEDRYYEDDYYDDDYYYDDHKSPQRRRRPHDDGYYVEAKSPLRFIPLFLVIALCVFAFIAAKEVCFDNPVNPSDYSKVVYTISTPVNTSELADDLHALGLIDNPLIFKLRCFFYGLDCKDGTYELSPCYSTEKIVNILSGYEYIDE